MKKKTHFLLIAGLVIQVAAFVGILVASNANGLNMEVLSGDSNSYIRTAKNLACCGEFSFSEGLPLIPDSVRTPGYPAFLAAVYSVTKSWIAALVIQIIVLSAVPLLLYLTLRRIHEPMAWIAALIFLFEPTRLFWSSLIMTDAVFMFSLLASVFVFYKWIESRENKHLIISGLLLGASTMIRPISLYLWIAFFAAIVFQIGFREWKKVLKACGIFILSFLILVSPWMVRNKMIYDSYQLSPLGSYSFAYANVTQYLHQKTGRSVDDIKNEFFAPLDDQIMENQVSLHNVGWYKEFAAQKLEGQYPSYLKFHVIKTIPFFITDGFREIGEHLGYLDGEQRPNLSNIFLGGGFPGGLIDYVRTQPIPGSLLLIGMGFWSLLWIGAISSIPLILKDKKNRAAWVLIVLIIGYMVAAASGPVAQPRYRLPITGFLLFMSLLGWRWILRFFKKKLKRDNLVGEKEELGSLND